MIIILGVVGPKPLLALLLIPAALLFYAQILSTESSVESVKRVHWVAGVREFEDGTIVLDRSGMTDTSTFSVPVLGSDPQALGNIAKKIEKRALDRSLLLPHAEQQHAGGIALNAVEADICLLLDDFANIFYESQEERVEIAALDNNSPELEGLAGYTDSLRPIDYIPHSNNMTETTDNTLDKLRQMSHFSQSYTDSSPVEDAAARILSLTKSQLSDMDEVRRRSLLEVIQPMLDNLRDNYRLPMVKSYCPACFERMQGRNNSIGDFITAKATDMKEKIEKINAFIRTTRLKFNTTADRWECPMCRATFKDGEFEPKTCERFKEELVYPLWDVLWMELSSERAEVLREKEQERREAINHELVELEKVVGEFGQERRLIRTKLNDLNETSLKTSETLRSMIQAFTDYRIIDSSQSTQYDNRVEKVRGSHQSGLDEIGKQIETAHNLLLEESNAVKEKRKPIVDAVDEVKVQGRFFRGSSESIENDSGHGSEAEVVDAEPDDQLDDNGEITDE